MRRVLLLIASLVLVGLVGGVSAQEAELPAPGITPDSPFYFLEIISEITSVPNKNFFFIFHLLFNNFYFILFKKELLN